jgi:uncharacterized repeat protein (TIGR04076 family)
MYKVKITILKRMANPDLIAEYAGDKVRETRLASPQCGLFADGQEFTLSDASEVPDGFCAWAWADIHREILAISAGGDLTPWLKKPGVAIACCSDGFRPVVFKIERGEAIG